MKLHISSSLFGNSKRNCLKSNRNIYLSLFLFWLITVFSPIVVKAIPQNKIFILHSYSQEYPWTMAQHKGFIETINSHLQYNASYTVEYLDTKRHPYDSIYANEMEKFLLYKYNNYQPSAIYVTDDDALTFARNRLTHIFPNIPIFFSGINNFDVKKNLNPDLFTGVFELKDVTPNIEWLLKMDKNANDITFIGDGSNTYKAIELDARKDLKSYNLHTTFIVEKRLDIVLDKLKKLPGKYIILTTLGGMTDSKGEILSLREIMKSLAQTGRIIISMEDGYIIEGVLGGNVTSGNNQGASAAHQLLEYLKGKKVSDIPAITKSPNAWIFDDNIIQKFKINLPENISKQAVILNPRLNFYEKYKNAILGSLIGIVLLFCIFITISLFVLLRKNRDLEAARNILRDSEESYRNQFENNSAMMLLIDQNNGSIIDANKTAIAFYGYTKDILLHMNISDINTLPSPEVWKYMSSVKEGEGMNFNFQHRLANGKIIDIETSVSKILFGNRPVLHSIIYDITNRKQAEEKLAKYTSQIEIKNTELDAALANEKLATIKANEMANKAEQANKAKSMFLANMSHEIRTPLNAIIGFSQLMDRGKLSPEVQKDYLTSIINAGEHLLTLINNILELSKVEAGHIFLNPTNINLHTLFDDIKVVFNDQLKNKNLHFLLEIADDLPKYVFIDENKLKQILINLIGNAVKFTDHGGIAVRARVDKLNDISKLIVEIQDSGSGISENEIENLFKHFVQTTTGINKGSGTGLGLALSKELINIMGGDITVKSELGKGTIFTFNVDLKEGDIKKSEAIVVKNIIRVDDNQKKYLILVVDDKIENQKIVVKFLTMVGFETIVANNGKEAIDKFEENNPDLILMDMRMPIMDGYEATRNIKLTEKGQQTPIIALTASSFEDEQNKIEKLNMQGHIRKPFRKNELYNVIGKILDVKYIYDEQADNTAKSAVKDTDFIKKAIANLPDKLVLKMLNAIAIADLDILLELIKTIEKENIDLSDYLKNLANNYEYENLQKLLINK